SCTKVKRFAAKKASRSPAGRREIHAAGGVETRPLRRQRQYEAVMDQQKTKHRRQLRRRRHVRSKVKGSAERPRLTVFRSSKHIYAQLIDDMNGVTLASASSRGKGA